MLDEDSRDDWSRFFSAFEWLQEICVIGNRLLFDPALADGELLRMLPGAGCDLQRVEFWTSAQRIEWDDDLKVVLVRQVNGGPRVRYLYRREGKNDWALASEDEVMVSAHARIDDGPEM
jgi:hypothetical protein